MKFGTYSASFSVCSIVCLLVAFVSLLKTLSESRTHIRSPLNVVHAGLDLLVSEIKDADPEAGTVPISRSTVELIYWIFSSSESAIEILNDLLQYEQMDAGGLRLYMYMPHNILEMKYDAPLFLSFQGYSIWSSAGVNLADLSITN